MTFHLKNATISKYFNDIPQFEYTINLSVTEKGGYSCIFYLDKKQSSYCLPLNIKKDVKILTYTEIHTLVFLQ